MIRGNHFSIFLSALSGSSPFFLQVWGEKGIGEGREKVTWNFTFFNICTYWSEEINLNWISMHKYSIFGKEVTI